jgi:hypothetical protein
VKPVNCSRAWGASLTKATSPARRCQRSPGDTPAGQGPGPGLHVLAVVSQEGVQRFRGVPVAHVPVSDVASGERRGKGVDVMSGEAPTACSARSRTAASLSSVVGTANHHSAMASRSVVPASLRRMVAPGAAHGSPNPGHGHPSELCRSLEIGLPVPAGRLVGGGGELALERVGRLLDHQASSLSLRRTRDVPRHPGKSGDMAGADARLARATDGTCSGAKRSVTGREIGLSPVACGGDRAWSEPGRRR